MPNNSRPSITREEKLNTIRQLRKLSNHQSELLLPDGELYGNPLTDETLERAAKKIFVWLGAKPRNISYIVNYTADYSLDTPSNGSATIMITSKQAATPSIGVAVLARSCISYFLAQKGHDVTSEIIELASVELGLGLIVINSIRQPSLGTKMGNVILGEAPSQQPLRYFSARDYGKLFESYVEDLGVDKRVVLEHTLPQAMPYLSKPMSTVPARSPERYVIEAQETLRSQRIKRIGAGFCVVATFCIGVFLWQQLPRSISPELQAQKESIDVLFQAHNTCQTIVQKNESLYDKNDPFSLGKLESERLRCISIKNKHDYLVRDYNQKVQVQYR